MKEDETDDDDGEETDNGDYESPRKPNWCEFRFLEHEHLRELLSAYYQSPTTKLMDQIRTCVIVHSEIAPGVPLAEEDAEEVTDIILVVVRFIAIHAALYPDNISSVDLLQSLHART